MLCRPSILILVLTLSLAFTGLSFSSDDTSNPSMQTSSNGIEVSDLVFYHVLRPAADEELGGFTLRSDFDRAHGVEASEKSNSNETVNNGNCTTLHYSGSSVGKLNIIFLASHFYPDAGEGSLFASDVDIAFVDLPPV